MMSIKDCSAETVFPDAGILIQDPPLGYAVNSGGPKGMDTKSLVWDVADDPCHVPGCVLVLTKFLDGSPVSVRYHVHDVYKERMDCGWEFVYVSKEIGYRVRKL